MAAWVATLILLFLGHWGWALLVAFLIILTED